MATLDQRDAGAPPPGAEEPVPAEERQSQIPFPVVGIGASAGGLEAFRSLLEHLPERTGMAFLLVQHLDPRHESRLPDLLGKISRLPVVEATNGMAVQPDRVHIIPPNSTMVVEKGALRLTPRPETRGPHLPIDHLFRSLAQSQHARAIGVVLSGTGADGTIGLAEIKAVGGITFAQDEKSAAHAGMPHSAVESGAVDFVLPPDEIARRLAGIGEHPYLAPARPVEEPQDADSQYKKILGILRNVMGVDFSLYRDTTIRRRIMRRMALHTESSIQSYAQALARDRVEVEALYHDLLINVTSFFRDPDLFDTLKERIFPEILRGKSSTSPVRIWVPGCSSGQEAYSLAMVLIEFFDDKPVRLPIQIFATDLSDQVSLEKARGGAYPESIEAEVSPERLRRFFKHEDHVYRIEKALRDICVFARQNVAADPPFSHLDLISCRNLLIYLSPPLQKRVLPTFHYSLNVPGFLVLGTAETVGDHVDLFDIVDREYKVYSKKATGGRPALSFAAEDLRAITAAAGRRLGPIGPSSGDFQREADRILLGRYAPPGVLVNESFDILQFRGRTSPYLELPPGEPTTNLLKMARDGLFLELRNALNEAKVRHVPVRRERLRLRGDEQGREVNLEIVPVRPSGLTEACFLVLFEESNHAAAPAGEAPPPEELPPPAEPHAAAQGAEQELRALRQELSATKEYLQSMVEQQDAANEELRSANEEILSSNEELQSTNEELETAKEELQSANEELTTVNEQLHHRNLELTQVNNDLTNLLSSTQIPVVMVGGDLRIRRFTGPARPVMNLLPTDVGRPIGDIKPSVDVPDMEALISEVIESVEPRAREVRDRAGLWHELRIYPYRTSENRIEGAVVVLLDIDQRKRAEEALREADRRKDEFLAILAHELRNPLAPIRNAVEILQRAGQDPGAIEQARDVLGRQVNQLARIVDDLVDVGRIVAKKIELRRERVALRTIVDTAVETCRSLIDSRGHELMIQMPPEPILLDADPVRLAQVLINLLHNAAKYTEARGHIWLTAERTGSPVGDGGEKAGHGEVLLRVRDDGIGVRPEFLPRMFEMFTQGDLPANDLRSGLGIGLLLARNLVVLHGGSIEAKSPGPGQGTEMVVRLPLAPPGPEPVSGPVDSVRPTSKPGSQRPKRVLIIDDNEDLAESQGALLELLGHDVRVTHDGPSGLELVATFAPEMVVVDIGMPGMSGHEVARRIRANPELRRAILVAQTGWGQEEDRRRSLEAGFDHHLVKPVSIDRLEEILRSLPEP